MKKLIIISFIVAATAVAGKAQEIATDSAGMQTESSAAVQDGYAEIKPADLPSAVKKSLEGPEYKGWIINAASYNKKNEKYSVELKNGADTKKLTFNKEGKMLND